ncbi:unnamed protein product, partial [Penicillium discolor]
MWPVSRRGSSSAARRRSPRASSWLPNSLSKSRSSSSSSSCARWCSTAAPCASWSAAAALPRRKERRDDLPAAVRRVPRRRCPRRGRALRHRAAHPAPRCPRADGPRPPPADRRVRHRDDRHRTLPLRARPARRPAHRARPDRGLRLPAGRGAAAPRAVDRPPRAPLANARGGPDGGAGMTDQTSRTGGLGRDIAQIVLSSRPISWINTAFPFAAAYLLSTREIDATFVIGTLYFLIPYNLAMYGINDVFDYASDLANPRKGGIEGALLSPRIHRATLWAAAVTNVPFLVYLFAVGTPASWLWLAVSVFAVLAYSAPVLRFKERPFLDSVTSSTHFVSPALVGLSLAGAPVTTTTVLVL